MKLKDYSVKELIEELKSRVIKKEDVVVVKNGVIPKEFGNLNPEFSHRFVVSGNDKVILMLITNIADFKDIDKLKDEYIRLSNFQLMNSINNERLSFAGFTTDNFQMFSIVIDCNEELISKVQFDNSVVRDLQEDFYNQSK